VLNEFKKVCPESLLYSSEKTKFGRKFYFPSTVCDPDAIIKFKEIFVDKCNQLPACYNVFLNDFVKDWEDSLKPSPKIKMK